MVSIAHKFLDQDKQPNVIWILGDQHRSQMLGCNGDPNIFTPNIDNLSTMGVNFTGAVSGFPLCCPFRGSMLTGIYPHKCVPGHEYPLPSGQPTIANVFNDAGYQTAYIGKWHLDGFHEWDGQQVRRAAMHTVPKERRGGFKYWLGYENNNSQWDSWVHGHEDEKEIDLFRLKEYETDALTNQMISYITDRGRDKIEGKSLPFFAVLSVQPPHDPYIAPEQFMGRHTPGNIKMRPNVPEVPRVIEKARREISGAYAQVENLDWNVGRIIKALKETGLDLDTHILFFSDHGDMHGSHGQFRKTGPYEESIRVPFIISGENTFYNGRNGSSRMSIPVNHVDIAPTTLGLCGIDHPDWMEGTDYSHYRLKWRPRDPKEPDSAYLQCVIATGHEDSVDRPWRGLVTCEGWKYVCLEGTPWMMFNLNEDPYEQINLAYNSKYHKKRKELNDRLKKWVIDTSDKFTLPEF